MTAPAIQVPQSIMDLRAKLASSDLIARFDTVAPLYGLPKYADFPRPGESGAWDFRRWLDWGRPYEFREADHPTGDYYMRHDETGLGFSMSKASGDRLSGYAGTSQFRRAAVERMDILGCCFIALIDRAIAGKLTLPSVESAVVPALKLMLVDAKATMKIYKEYAERLNNYVSDADHQAAGSIAGVLKTLDKEFRINARQAFVLIGLSELADKFALHARQPMSTLPGSAIALVNLKSLLEERRAVRAKENDDRVAARNAEREARAKERAAGTKEKYEKDVVAHRAQVKTLLAASRSIAQNLLQMTDRQIEQIDKTAYPEFPGSPDELNEQLDAMRTKLEEAEADRDSWKARSEESDRAVNRMEGDIVAAQANAMHGGDELVKKALALTQLISKKLATSTDILSIGAAVKDVREQSVALGEFLRANFPTLCK